MAADVILSAIQLELERTVATEHVEDVDGGLIDLGWEPYLPAQDTGVIGSIWRHPNHDRAHAQSGTQGANFYFGVIASFDTDTDATRCLQRALDLVYPHLAASGLGPDRGDDAAHHLWTNDSHAVTFMLDVQRVQSTHVLPATLQFAIEPVTALVDNAVQSSTTRN